MKTFSEDLQPLRPIFQQFVLKRINSFVHVFPAAPKFLSEALGLFLTPLVLHQCSSPGEFSRFS